MAVEELAVLLRGGGSPKGKEEGALRKSQARIEPQRAPAWQAAAPGDRAATSCWLVLRPQPPSSPTISQPCSAPHLQQVHGDGQHAALHVGQAVAQLVQEGLKQVACLGHRNHAGGACVVDACAQEQGGGKVRGK